MARRQLGTPPSNANDAVRKQDAEAVVSTVTAVKTAGYTAAVGELVRADATAGGFTVMLPAAPVDGSRIIVKKIDTTKNALLVQRSGGSDVFNESNGPTLLHLALPGESVQLQYESGIWLVVAHSFAVPGLDGRYVRQGASNVSGWYNIKDTNGANSISITNTTNAVNHIIVANSPTGQPPIIYADGIDSHIPLQLRPKGDAGIRLNGGNGSELFHVVPVASAVNHWRFDSSATGNPLTLYANGSDTNISINIVTRGTGTLRNNGTSVLLTGGALGTPSSATLTNATGLPISGIVNCTSTRLSVGTSTSVATTAPVSINLGGTFGTNTAGDPGNLKVRVYDDGTFFAGFGLANTAMEYQVPNDNAHNFFVGGILRMSVTNAAMTLPDAANVVVGTTTGTKIATATTQKLSFWNATPAVQPTAVANATDAATVITQLNALLSRLRTIGLIAP